jgi:hypothetical protein
MNKLGRISKNAKFLSYHRPPTVHRNIIAKFKSIFILASWLTITCNSFASAAHLIYSTDFENITKVTAGGAGYYPGYSSIPINHNFWFEDTSDASWWMEGLEYNRLPAGITPHSGTRCVGMRVLAGSHGTPRAEFNLLNLNSLIGNQDGAELYISCWVFLPPDFTVLPKHQESPPISSGWMSIGDAFMSDGTGLPYVAFTLNPVSWVGITPETYLWYFGYRTDSGYQMLNTVNPYTQYLHLGEWYHLEYYVYRSSTTNGIVRYWINHQLLAEAKDIQTRNPDPNIDWFTTPIKIYYDNRDTTASHYIWIDDLAIYDGMPNQPTDTTAPTVAITFPVNGATISGTATVMGTAADNIALDRVEIQIDRGTLNLATGLANWSYALDARTLSTGSHTITARATDTSANTSTASIVITTGVKNVIAYPNPFKPNSKSGHDKITFDGLSAGRLNFKIYTMTGRLVNEWDEDTASGQVLWIPADKDGKPLASDTYIYLITDKNGDKSKGEICILR